MFTKQSEGDMVCPPVPASAPKCIDQRERRAYGHGKFPAPTPGPAPSEVKMSRTSKSLADHLRPGDLGHPRKMW